MSLKVAVITSTRAEYGLFFPLIQELKKDSYFNVQIIVTGTHLLKEYGDTIQYIREDGIAIAHCIPIMKSGKQNVNTVISKAITAFDAVYTHESYDAIIVLGDRYELYGFCIPALMNQIPIIHIHGGEKTEGAIDESIRHSITKMAALHFPSIYEYAKRIIQMGENPKYVYPVGALGVDNIMHLKPIKQRELEQEFSVNFNTEIAVVTFHPVTLGTIDEVKAQAEEVFEALVESGMTCIVTMPNSDTGGDVANQVIQTYVEKYKPQFIYRKSLGQRRYLSVLRYAKMVIGNSSSGILEVPSFGIPTIDIGDRQQGRFAPRTVIHCECVKCDIQKAIKKGKSEEFLDEIKGYESPYGQGNTASTICKILKKVDFKNENIRKKKFCDIEFGE
ncbi:MAG: UDP-N-acetylglucosamine 2-epimerase [Lachnospiraceae bacterium]